MDASFNPVMTKYNEFVKLEESLLNRGFNPGEVNKVLGRNAIELIHRVCG